MGEIWYPLALKVGGRTLFLLWASDDWALDRVLAEAGLVVWFSDEESAREYALAKQLTLAPKEELDLHDLDGAVRSLEADAEPDCRLLLAIWNLAGDVARSVNEPFEDRDGILDAVYNYLFFCSDLPSMTPSASSTTRSGLRRNSAGCAPVSRWRYISFVPVWSHRAGGRDLPDRPALSGKIADRQPRTMRGKVVRSFGGADPGLVTPAPGGGVSRFRQHRIGPRRRRA